LITFLLISEHKCSLVYGEIQSNWFDSFDYAQDRFAHHKSFDCAQDRLGSFGFVLTKCPQLLFRCNSLLKLRL
jgi:hypothetical protein